MPYSVTISKAARHSFQKQSPHNIVLPAICGKPWSEAIEDWQVAENFLDLEHVVIRLKCGCGSPASVSRQLVGTNPLGWPRIYWTYNHGEIPVMTWRQGAGDALTKEVMEAAHVVSA